MREADGLPSLEVGGRTELVLGQSEEELQVWVLVLKNTGLVTLG